MKNKFDNITKTIEFTAKELAVLCALVGSSSTSDINHVLDETKPTDHTASLFDPVVYASGSMPDPVLVLYRKIKAQMDAVRQETKPIPKVIYYYIAQKTHEESTPVYVSNSFDSYEDAEDSFNDHFKNSYKLVEIVRKEITV